MAFGGDNIYELGYNIVHKRPEKITDQYSPKLKNFIMKLLTKNKKKRPNILDMFPCIPEQIIQIRKRFIKR